MKVKALKPIPTFEGLRKVDEVFDMHPETAQHLADRGAVEIYETKVVREVPETPAAKTVKGKK